MAEVRVESVTSARGLRRKNRIVVTSLKLLAVASRTVLMIIRRNSGSCPTDRFSFWKSVARLTDKMADEENYCGVEQSAVSGTNENGPQGAVHNRCFLLSAAEILCLTAR